MCDIIWGLLCSITEHVWSGVVKSLRLIIVSIFDGSPLYMVLCDPLDMVLLFIPIFIPLCEPLALNRLRTGATTWGLGLMALVVPLVLYDHGLFRLSIGNKFRCSRLGGWGGYSGGSFPALGDCFPWASPQIISSSVRWMDIEAISSVWSSFRVSSACACPTTLSSFECGSTFILMAQL